MADDASPDSDGSRGIRTIREWFFLNGNRLTVAALLTLVVFVVLLSVTLSGVVPFEDSQPVYYVFGSLISGNLTVVTVVVSISQLLLSRQLDTPGALRDEIGNVTEYRRQIGSATGRVTPVEPLGFLRVLVRVTCREARALEHLAAECDDAALADDFASLGDRVTDRTDEVESLLSATGSSTFEVLSTTLSTNYAQQIHDLRRMEQRYRTRLPDDLRTCMEQLTDRLQDIDVARQYFKTIYFEQELAGLSRILSFVGLGAVAVMAVTLFLFTASDGAAVPRSWLPVVVACVVTIGLSPLAVLVAFVLRIATVSERTAAILPFTTPEQER